MNRPLLRHPLLQRSLLLPILLVSAMAALLGLVAWLQYRWTSQLSAATELRIAANIESVMVDWHWDFYRQFSTICVALQVGPDSGAYDEWDVYRDRYGHWQQEAAYPSLVRGLYLFETSWKSSPRFLKVDPGANLPRNVRPPPGMDQLIERLQSRSATLPSALRAWDLQTSASGSAPMSRYSSLSGWQFDPILPALVHPVVHHAVPGDPSTPPSGQAVDWIIVLLDMPTLRQRILPDLAHRYFRSVPDGPLKVTVEDRSAPARILFASANSPTGPEPADADATMNIFGPPPQSTEGYLWEAVRNTNTVQPREWHSFVAPVWFPVIRYSDRDQPWTLVLHNPAAGLNNVALRVRSDNLIVSTAVLILLAVNMSLIALSGYRAHRFARMQMDFVASVSHELRTPLTALLSAGENIKDGLIQDEHHLARYGRMITAQARQLIGLVDQILIFASMRNGDRRYQLVPLEIAPVLDGVMRASSSFIQSAGFTVEKQLAPDLPRVVADEQALGQCLQNLLSNAIKYSGSSRWIRISAQPGSLRGIPAVVIAVEDRGIGIASGDLSRIFKPFYRAPDVQAAQIHGTGLGLALARRIAEDLGGTLSVSSQPGHGSTFTLTLRAAADPAERPLTEQAKALA